MAIVHMQPCLVDLQWRLLADNAESTSWASNCKHARRFENQEYRACKPAQPTCTPAPRSARHSIDHVRCNLTHGNTRGATSLARGCLRSTIRSSLPDGGLFSPRTKLPMSICDLLISDHEWEPCCRECVFTAKRTKYFVGVRHKADRPYPEFKQRILPTPDRQAPFALYKTTQ